MELITPTGLYDITGRYLAPVPVFVPVRPSGPWDTNTAPPLVVICAWCVDFNPASPVNAGATHGICEPCSARMEQEAA